MLATCQRKIKQMHILIEQHQYQAQKVNDVLGGISTLQDIEGKVSVNYVGYYYNPKLKDCVFILPKVLMDENGRAFGKYDPEDIIHLDKQQRLKKEEHDFIYELSVWIYRAIEVFRDSKDVDTSIVLQQQMQQMAKGRLKKSNTFLDILLAIQKFNRENQDFFFFVLKNIHSGYNKINWTRTIAKSEAIIQQGTPIYLNPENKKKQINFDEELLIIYFSILQHIHDAYGFPVMMNVNFPLITGEKFKSYLNGFGKTRLKQIKYKYFSDKALYLWELCYAFFDQSKEINIECDEREYLLVKDFNIVFEAIIDRLVGTDASLLPEGLKNQEDGKIVDHLWLNDIILPSKEQKEVYYIGDSKYYKNGNTLGEKSIHKQYTYAHNVIQWSFDHKDDDRVDSRYKIKLRDEKTEGYNVIPNFFISAWVDFDKLDYVFDGLKLHDGQNVYRSSQFENRLFDRDTFLLSHYDVNFLFVLSLYARNNTSNTEAWRKKVRKLFKEHVQSLLEKEYDFYAIKPRVKGFDQKYFKLHFQDVLGKVFSLPSDNEDSIYSLALSSNPKAKEENEQLLDTLKHVFYVTPKLEHLNVDLSDPKYGLGETAYMPEGVANEYVIVGFCPPKHYAWVKKNGLYNMRMGAGNGSLHLETGALEAKYLLLHGGGKSIELLKLKTGGPRLFSKADLVKKGYPSEPHSDFYFVYSIDPAGVQKELKQYYWDIADLTSSIANQTAVPLIRTLSSLMTKAKK